MTKADDGDAAHADEDVRDGLGDEWSESAQHFIHAKRLSRCLAAGSKDAASMQGCAQKNATRPPVAAGAV
jgi:hypothetical protein